MASPGARLAVIAGLAAAVLTGCGGDDTSDAADPATTGASEPTTGQETASSPTADECTELFATSSGWSEVGELGEPEATTVAGVPACRAAVSDSRLAVTAAQVIALPAGAWAEGLPDAINQLLASGVITDQDNLDKLEDGRELIESVDGIDDDAACDLFTTLIVAVQHTAEDATSVINAVPTEDAPMAVNGQACSHGHYTSVQVENAAGVAAGTELPDLIRDVLADVHPGPLR